MKPIKPEQSLRMQDPNIRETIRPLPELLDAGYKEIAQAPAMYALQQGGLICVYIAYGGEFKRFFYGEEKYASDYIKKNLERIAEDGE